MVILKRYHNFPQESQPNILQIKTDIFTLVPKSNTNMGFSGDGNEILVLPQLILVALFKAGIRVSKSKGYLAAR